MMVYQYSTAWSYIDTLDAHTDGPSRLAFQTGDDLESLEARWIIHNQEQGNIALAGVSASHVQLSNSSDQLTSVTTRASRHRTSREV